MTSVKIVNISEQFAGQRIDNFLFRHYRKVPKARIYRAIRNGEVRVDSKRVKPTFKLQSDQQVRLPPLKAESAPNPVVPTENFKILQQRVLYEDDELLVFDKPSGMAVHGGSGVSYGVIEALRAMTPKQAYLELAHRLDKDTSGVMLIAKKPSILKQLHAMFRSGDVHKTYQVLTLGKWPKSLEQVSVPLRKITTASGERMVQVDDGGKPSLTEFAVSERMHESSLLTAHLLTGKTHQIRVHCAHSGHPIIGDPKYGNAVMNRKLQKFGANRLMLHAHQIEFRLPGHHKYCFVAPIPDDMSALIKQLRKLKSSQ